MKGGACPEKPVQLNLHPLLLELFNIDNLVEVGLFVGLSGFDLTFHHRQVGVAELE
jgi:hypothetical protein